MSEDYMGVPGLTYEDYQKMQEPVEQQPIKYFGDNRSSPYGIWMNKPKTTPTPAAPKEVYLSASPSVSTVSTTSQVKIATPQYVNFNEESLNPLDVDAILRLYFEQINGKELLILSNRNFISSQNIAYQPISNVSSFKNQYDPKKILALQDTSDSYFSNFSIKLDAKIPTSPTSESTNNTNVYMKSNGDLVIELVNLENDEIVEIQTLLNGTIYKDLIEE